MYKYKFNLTPARTKSDISFTNYANLIIAAVNNVNSGITFKRDCKQIELNPADITDKNITLNLYSKEYLVNPARSLSGITRFLTTTYPESFSPYIYNKTLFNMSLLSQSSSQAQTNDELSNEDLFKAIFDLLYSSKHINNKQKNIAINQLKDIVKPFM